MPAIEITGLTKRFGSFVAIDSVGLKVAAGDRLAILGASGAGKSTLLRLISGLETPDVGSIAIDGVDVSRALPHQRNLVLMSQDYPLYPQLCVRKNLEAALISLSLSRSAREARCSEVLSWFDIAELAEKLPSQLSGGQAQRVAFAKALVRNPAVLLLDEPLSQVDATVRENLRELILKVVEHASSSLILVTHDAVDALRLVNKVAILNEGKLVQLDSPEAVYRAPTTRASAELLSMFGVHWLNAERLARFSASLLKQQAAEELNEGRELGFRPELCGLSASYPDDRNSLTIEAKVEIIQFLGFARLVTLRVEHDLYRCLVTSDNNTVEVGSRLVLIVPPTAMVRVPRS